jgi:hypothetical protein
MDFQDHILFRSWIKLAPPQTRYLADLVISQLLPKLEDLGFRADTSCIGTPAVILAKIRARGGAAQRNS